MKALIFSSVLMVSCNASDKLEGRLKEYYESHPLCKTEQSCPFSLRDVTWFKWDTIKLREDEAGIHWEFFLNKEIVYTYFKRGGSFEASGIEFGMGNNSIKDIYLIDSAIFDLKVAEHNGDFIYFLLPQK